MSTDSPSTKSPLEKLRIQRPAETPRRSGVWRWLVGFLLLLGVVVGGLYLSQLGAQDSSSRWAMIAEAMESKVEVRLATLTVERGQAADATVVATGYLESRRQAKIGARAPGRIETVKVEEGSRVTANEILAVLEHADLDASLAAAEANAAGARAQLAEHLIEIERKRMDRDRAENLHLSNSVSAAALDTARFDFQSAIARKDSLESNIKLAEARVREAEQMKENMFIRAPFDGTVISKDAEVGESILPGGMGEASGRGSVVTIADLEHLEVDCDVKEDFISRVVVDHPCEVAVDAVPDRRYQGQVRKVIPMGDRARATIKVKVSILDADDRLFPDMSATVYFLPAVVADAVEPDRDLPRLFCDANAIRHDGDQAYVWVVDEQSRLSRADITTGATRDRRTEITGGLTPDSRVVIAPDSAQIGQMVKMSSAG
ncbi:MAG: efflux RND transporter periplasmic adaptor subunit [Planctomycetales bacterium]|nr:efflux RND transporter periplasmic adaptor subunit [Planctomycetales bacterium]